MTGVSLLYVLKSLHRSNPVFPGRLISIITQSKVVFFKSRSAKIPSKTLSEMIFSAVSASLIFLFSLGSSSIIKTFMRVKLAIAKLYFGRGLLSISLKICQHFIFRGIIIIKWRYFELITSLIFIALLG